MTKTSLVLLVVTALFASASAAVVGKEIFYPVYRKHFHFNRTPQALPSNCSVLLPAKTLKTTDAQTSVSIYNAVLTGNRTNDTSYYGRLNAKIDVTSGSSTFRNISVLYKIADTNTFEIGINQTIPVDEATLQNLLTRYYREVATTTIFKAIANISISYQIPELFRPQQIVLSAEQPFYYHPIAGRHSNITYKSINTTGITVSFDSQNKGTISGKTFIPYAAVAFPADFSGLPYVPTYLEGVMYMNLTGTASREGGVNGPVTVHVELSTYPMVPNDFKSYIRDITMNYYRDYTSDLQLYINAYLSLNFGQ